VPATAWGLPTDSMVTDADGVAIWRQGRVLLVQVTGVIDDGRSALWRHAVDEHIAERGLPRMCAFDFSGCEPQNSMAARYRTATWGRALAQKIEWASLFTGGAAGPSFVVRTAIRLIGMSHVVLRFDEAEFQLDVSAMLQGKRRDVESHPPGD
jgi:hypothetical protein